MTEQVTVDIAVPCDAWPPLAPLIEKAAFRTLQDSGYFKKNKNPVELSVVLTDNDEIRILNKKYRGKDKPTNVLSFPQDDPALLGDVVLAYKTILEESQQQGKSFENHALHMVIHGILHLIGHDHENDRDAETMESLEISILESFGVENPYTGN
ncbi:MAG: rRNA maturation RNase YbeY [Alphaproteobacteria bacterium]|nr:rRNA maturation RNase YbeY [Alphaproteobacteria bacterium]